MDTTQTAVIESPVFVLEGPKISFLIGGGLEQKAYVTHYTPRTEWRCSNS